MHPVDIATTDTVKFVQANLSPGSKRLLEVGCGKGELARELQNLGYQIIALDADPNAVEQTRALGIEARQATWPDFEEAPFDAILFTRSLHHIPPLAAALEKARSLLGPGGKIIIEDFAYEEIDRKTSEWLYGLALVLKSGGLLETNEGFVKAFLENGGNFEFWHHFRSHDLHPGATIEKALQEGFSHLTAEKTLTLYRYFLGNLPQDDRGYALAGSLFEAEQRLGEAGGIELIGRRFVVQI
jgi:cyclopropane fatty-acyl-phospholipid synthase-like methyltransferase